MLKLCSVFDVYVHCITMYNMWFRKSNKEQELHSPHKNVLKRYFLCWRQVEIGLEVTH